MDFYNPKHYLIALSGKMGHGKNLTANIIGFLLCDIKGGRTGQSFTDAEIAEGCLDQGCVDALHDSPSNKWVEKRFAEKVKLVASLLTGIPVEKFEDQEFKKTLLGPEWTLWGVQRDQGKYSPGAWFGSEQELRQSVWFTKYHGSDTTRSRDPNMYIVQQPMTVRDLLQKVGTDAMRDRLHPEVWVNSLFADWRMEISVNHNEPIPGTDAHVRHMMGLDMITQWPAQQWLITDMRFPNELRAVQSRGGLTIRVVRPGHDSGSTHPSETALDRAEQDGSFDEVLVNDGTLEELVAEVRAILVKHQLLGHEAPR